MRRLFLAVSLLICTSPLAAQDARPSASHPSFAAVTPLPPELTPDALRDQGQERRISGLRVLRGIGIGAGVGAGVGAVLAYSAYTGCSGEEFCLFSRDEETLMGAVFGAGLGAVIGGTYMLLTPARRTEEPVLTVAPAQDGGVRLEARLTH
ncbi:MAG TPA: hypothetical protein VF665_09605 [Longimicrobium sp.]|jgi:hypothetical protein|uniref:hypothetical protein n=1 Tax=Longimicrobium sp. TaxID=2029185 RepID=UPI002EDB0B08